MKVAAFALFTEVWGVVLGVAMDRLVREGTLLVCRESMDVWTLWGGGD